MNMVYENKKRRFISELFQSLFESYPDCLETIRTQFDIIAEGKKPTNIIGEWIEDEVITFIRSNPVRGK